MKENCLKTLEGLAKWHSPGCTLFKLITAMWGAPFVRTNDFRERGRSFSAELVEKA